jgi:zinc/manganese transport system substrate-binding protein
MLMRLWVRLAELLLIMAITAVGATDASALGGKIAVVAAENFYGDVAQQIGGDFVSVTSVLSNPDQDPHLFETSPSVIREIASAQIVIYNGVNYDPWMERLFAATPKAGRFVIAAAGLMHKAAGDNPHLWYDPATMPKVAAALAAAFSKADPAHAEIYAARLKTFSASLEPLDRKIAAIRAKFGGAAVTATEPVFDYMAAALDLKMRNQRFQLAIMNRAEPSAGDLAAFERDLVSHAVRLMFYNKQASDAIVRRLIELARASKVPVVATTETCPPGLSYQDWIIGELDKTAAALAGPSS